MYNIIEYTDNYSKITGNLGNITEMIQMIL